MHKPFLDMTLKDLMDRLEDTKYESKRQDVAYVRPGRQKQDLLSVDAVAEFLGASPGEIRQIIARGPAMPVFFQKPDLHA